MNQRHTIKAIETRYGGCRFRSRLEARWACFFDALEIPWQYELEGFELGDGLRYLPDFYLPKHAVFVEVKPTLASLSRRDWDKLARFINHQNLLLVAGMPGAEQMYLFQLYRGVGDEGLLQELLEENFEDSESWSRFFLENFHDRLVVLAPNVVFFPRPADSESDNFQLWGFMCRSWRNTSERMLSQAASLARSARFEFGENP